MKRLALLLIAGLLAWAQPAPAQMLLLGVGSPNVVAGPGPDPFAFTDVTGATTSTLYTSNAVTMTNLVGTGTLSVSVGGEWDKNSAGSWSSSGGSVVNGDTVRVRITSSASASTAVNVTLTVNSTFDTYTVTTASAGGSSAILLQTGTDALLLEGGAGKVLLQ